MKKKLIRDKVSLKAVLRFLRDYFNAFSRVNNIFNHLLENIIRKKSFCGKRMHASVQCVIARIVERAKIKHD